MFLRPQSASSKISRDEFASALPSSTPELDDNRLPDKTNVRILFVVIAADRVAMELPPISQH